MSEKDTMIASAGAVDDGVFFVSVRYRGTAYPVPVQEDDAIATIFDFVQEALDFPRENCKLIYGGKTIRPDRDVATVGQIGLKADSKMMLVASSAQDVSFVQNSRPDPLVKGFVEEERDEISRRKRARAAGASAWGTKQDKEYCFNSIKAEFKFSTPPPFDAEKLLQKLATDPGIIDIMKSRKFKVGILTEMSPVEAQERMSKRGTPDMDLLGYNQNAGEKIVLKLRTDNLKGFRPYHDILNTLIHEMTHNVWGPHDQKFWKLYGELKAQYMRFHRFWSHSGKSAEGASQFQGFAGGDSEEIDEGRASGGGFGQILGGAAPSQMSPRARRLLAAEARAALGEGPEEPMKPNFLAGNGQWIFVCPCGQVHDPAGCEIAQAGTSTASATAVDETSADVDIAATREELEGTTDVAKPVVEVGFASPKPSGSDVHMTQEAPGAPPVSSSRAAAAWSCPACFLDNDAEILRCAACAAARPPQKHAAADLDLDFGLDLADLQAQGLDGAAVWLARFSQRLQSLRGLSASGARAAVELMLKLVCNIVEHPIDPKFRRVRADNPNIRAALSGAGEVADNLMCMLGFEVLQEQSVGKVYMLRDTMLDAARLRLGKELLERELEASAVLVAAAA